MMPTTDPAKNVQAKKKETLGNDAYNKINAVAERRHRDKKIESKNRRRRI